jgi:hypothetical protein
VLTQAPSEEGRLLPNDGADYTRYAGPEEIDRPGKVDLT